MKLHYIIALLIVLSSCARKSLKYDSKLMWEQNFMQQDNLDEWRINNNTFYGNNETLFLSENVFLTDSGLIVLCKDCWYCYNLAKNRYIPAYWWKHDNVGRQFLWTGIYWQAD